ncbi:MAG: hypothetical protein HPY50_12950 [Firmicutes bacterium]|nr:hypothetical protein [Bacillota bacterium]
MSLKQELTDFQQEMEKSLKILLREADVIKHGSCPQCPFKQRCDDLDRAASNLQKGLALLDKVIDVIDSCDAAD